MAMKVTDDGETAKKKHGLRRLLVTLVVIAVILYVFLFLAARTDGARSLVEKWMSDKIGSQVTIRKMAMTLPFGLAMEDVRTKDFTGDSAGVDVGEMKMVPGGRTALSLSAKNVKIVLEREGEEGWGPRLFEKVGDLPLKDIGEISRVTESFRERLSVVAERISITWIDQGGEILAMVEDASFSVEPVFLPSGKWHYYSLKIYKCEAPGLGGLTGKDIAKEWLADENRPYVELKSSGKTGDEAGGEFWGKKK